MSLVALAMRLTLTQALAGKTLAEDAVYDSNVVDLDRLIEKDKTRLLITVATDEQEGTFDGLAYDIANRKIDLVIEIAAAQGVRVEIEAAGDDPPEEAVMAEIKASDAGLEMTVDIIARQIMATIQGGDGWADLFRDVAGKPVKFTSKRGAGWEKGPRFAARQIVITYEPLFEPTFGLPPGHYWRRLIAKVTEAGGDLAQHGALIAKVIEGTPIPEWRQLQVDLGLSDDAARAHGAGAQSGVGEEPTAADELASDGDHLGYVVEPAPPEEEGGP
jgi:hypothetical protein